MLSTGGPAFWAMVLVRVTAKAFPKRPRDIRCALACYDHRVVSRPQTLAMIARCPRLTSGPQEKQHPDGCSMGLGATEGLGPLVFLDLGCQTPLAKKVTGGISPANRSGFCALFWLQGFNILGSLKPNMTVGWRRAGVWQAPSY